MHKKIIIANFKAEMNLGAIQDWCESFADIYKHIHHEGRQVILCPSFVHIPFFRDHLIKRSVQVELGAQDVSQFDHGAHTGEVTASALVGLVDYVLLGHSERRHQAHETFDTIQTKIDMCARYDLKSLVCAQKGEVYTGHLYAVAYEPEASIGTGHAASPEAAYSVMKEIHRNVVSPHTIYGGSVDRDNVSTFTELFNGILVGKKSLDPHHLCDIIRNA